MPLLLFIMTNLYLTLRPGNLEVTGRPGGEGCGACYKGKSQEGQVEKAVEHAIRVSHRKARWRRLWSML